MEEKGKKRNAKIVRKGRKFGEGGVSEKGKTNLGLVRGGNRGERTCET